MNRIELDEPKLKEMQDFLTYLYLLGSENNDIEINRSLVYRELCKYELEGNDIKNGELTFCKDLFDKWENRNKKEDGERKGLTTLYKPSWPHFLQFYSSGDREYFNQNMEFIKLYIPMKYDQLYESVNTLFDYIRDSKIRHVSKVADKIRTDNVIVRLEKDNIKDALKIIEFVNQNEIIKNNLNETNPFIPTINGIGFMYESGISYNDEISISISRYVGGCIKNANPPLLSDFYKWFRENYSSREVRSIFLHAIGERKYIHVNDEQKDSNHEKYQLLIDSLKATFIKYDLNQAVAALKALLEEGKYDYFTNGNGEIKYRNELAKKVSAKDAMRYVKSAQNNYDINIYSIINYCQNIFKKEMLDDFCEACMTTYSNYGESQLKIALKKMIESGDSKWFSRYAKDDVQYQKNYRDIIEKYDKNGIINLIKLFLRINYINYKIDDVNELIETFIGGLKASYYKDDEKGKTR